jgi:hypothetical protein
MYHDHTSVFSAMVADAASLEPRCRELLATGCDPRLRSEIALSSRKDLACTYGRSLKGLGAEGYNSSRTPGMGLGACQKLRPREEAGEKMVMSHGIALPPGEVRERKTSDLALSLSYGARPVK